MHKTCIMVTLAAQQAVFPAAEPPAPPPTHTHPAQVSEVLEQWVTLQRQWMYLEPIFSSAGARRGSMGGSREVACPAGKHCAVVAGGPIACLGSHAFGGSQQHHLTRRLLCSCLSADIVQQLPLEAKRFSAVDRMWRKAMESARRSPLVLKVGARFWGIRRQPFWVALPHVMSACCKTPPAHHSFMPPCPPPPTKHFHLPPIPGVHQLQAALSV